VYQANADAPHDFMRDPVEPVLRDGWLLAEHTTLGADNGVGVALILAALEDERLTHGPLEALLTVDEESGMGGVRGLAADALAGRWLLNLDSEEWGHFCVGCAGGIDVDVRRPGTPEVLPDDSTVLRVDVRGLVGGHSGMAIHEGRGHAIKLLVRALFALWCQLPFRLVSLRGGSARNALPREAFAIIAVPRAAAPGVAGLLSGLQATFREALAGIDDKVALHASEAPHPPGEVVRAMNPAEQSAWLAALYAAPQGVRRMSLASPGVVETSDNLGIVDLTPDRGECDFLVRSLVDSASAELAEEIVDLFTSSGATARTPGHYPGWTPDPASPLLSLCREVYRTTFGGEPVVEVIHAGLECGLIGSKYPEMDKISFGPTIRGAHAPGEAVEVVSVERCWRLLREILAVLA
jgi:dipeptidase D